MTHAPQIRRRPSSGGDDAAPAPPDYRPAPPPDGGWGWVVVFGSFMIHIVMDGVTYSFGVLYEQFLLYFHASKAATAWVASILVGVTLCSGPISSSFVNRFGCRAVTIAGSILASASLAVSVFAPNVATLYLTIGIGAGLGFGLIYLPAIVSVTCYFEKYRSLATGIAVCGSGLGTFIFAPFIGLLVQRLQWQGAMLVIAGLVLCCVAFGALFRPLEVDELPLEASPPPPQARRVPTVDLGPREGTLNLPERRRNGSAVDLTSTGMLRQLSVSHSTMPRVAGKQPGAQEASRLALSQPALVSGVVFDSHSLRRKNSGIMYRKDIFYRGSLHNIPYHRSAPWLNQDHASEESQLVKPFLHDRKVARTADEEGNQEQNDEEEEKGSQVMVLGCVPCSRETKDTLTEMLDFSLFKDPIFLLFTCSNFLTSIGFNIPYVYIKVQAIEKGISENQGDYLLSVMGIANLLGRIVLGYISDKPWTNRLLVYNVCLTLCGVGTALSAFCTDFASFAFYGALFGFTTGAYVGLTSVILVDLLGLDRLTNAFGLLLLFQGIASLVGSPLGGFLYDVLESYDYAFYLAGTSIAASGLMLFIVPYCQRRVVARHQDLSPSQGAVMV